jgi:hypothetical protein
MPRFLCLYSLQAIVGRAAHIVWPECHRHCSRLDSVHAHQQSLADDQSSTRLPTLCCSDLPPLFLPFVVCYSARHVGGCSGPAEAHLAHSTPRFGRQWRRSLCPFCSSAKGGQAKKGEEAQEGRSGIKWPSRGRVLFLSLHFFLVGAGRGGPSLEWVRRAKADF